MATSHGEVGSHPISGPESDPDVPGPAFDAQRLRAECADAALIRSVVLELLSELPKHVHELRASLADERLEALATHARRLAQLFTSLLAFPASEAALRLRYAAEVASPRMSEALAGLEGEIERLTPELAEQFDIVC